MYATLSPARDPDNHGTHSLLTQEPPSTPSTLLPTTEPQTMVVQTFLDPECPIPEPPLSPAQDPSPSGPEVLPTRDPDNNGPKPPPVQDLASSPSTQLPSTDLPTPEGQSHQTMNAPSLYTLHPSPRTPHLHFFIPPPPRSRSLPRKPIQYPCTSDRPRNRPPRKYGPSQPLNTLHLPISYP